jgi:hypothetical protein
MTADRRHDRFPARVSATAAVTPLGDRVPDPVRAAAHPAPDLSRWTTASPESLAERTVGVAGGCHYVRLAVPGADPVYFGPYPNPAVARERADHVRRFVAALLRASGRR